MSIASSVSPVLNAPIVPPEILRRFSVAEYHAMIEHGILHDERVELLRGWLTQPMNRGPAHSTATKLIERSLERVLSEDWLVRVQEPITLTDSEPEPDIAIVLGNIRSFSQTHPQAADVALVVEVAQTSIAQDRGLKLSIYAGAGIPQYWIMNLPERSIEVYSQVDPTGLRYQQRRDFRAGELLPLILRNAVIAELDVAGLLP
ncbi:MAG: Uma2 family endonuclease [Planctomycetales bacterium]|nr:Uma2 family endonuclease [Planctomycetales bacterium]